MKRMISLLLALVFVVMCCGCQQDAPNHTTPSDTQPSENVQTPTDDTEDPDAPLEVSYVTKEFKKIALLPINPDVAVPSNDGNYVARANIQVFRTLEDVENSKLANWKFFNAYNEAYFESNSLIVVSGYFMYLPAMFTLPDLTKHASDSYTASFTVYALFRAVESMEPYLEETFAIEVYEKIPADAEVNVSLTLIFKDEWDYGEEAGS